MQVSIVGVISLWFFTLIMYVFIIAGTLLNWRRLGLLGRLSWMLILAGWTLATVGFYYSSHYIQQVGSGIIILGSGALLNWRRLGLLGRLSWMLILAGWTLATVGFYYSSHYIQQVGFCLIILGIFALIVIEYSAGDRK